MIFEKDKCYMGTSTDNGNTMDLIEEVTDLSPECLDDLDAHGYITDSDYNNGLATNFIWFKGDPMKIGVLRPLHPAFANYIFKNKLKVFLDE